MRTFSSILKPEESPALDDGDYRLIAEDLAAADVVGLACMSDHAGDVKRLIDEVRRLNPKATIIWGGVHAIVAPEDAINHADAVCTGEGEVAFPQLLERLGTGEDYRNVENFWFRSGADIVRAPYRPLLTSEDLGALPHPVYGDEWLYKRGHGFARIAVKDYLDFEALSYNTVWSRGCPFRCSFCANTAFLAIDKEYGRLRHAPVSHIVDEVKTVIRRFPHVSFVAFHDDCLIGLPEDVLRDFSSAWKERVGVPFTVHGLTPAHVSREKLAILLEGGLNRVRLGVQSGSDRILKFYRRPNRPGLVKEATDAVGHFAKQMLPPAYDIILDNPIETKEDVEATLRLIQNLPRPFTLNVYSLRYIPNTELGRQLAELSYDVEGIDHNYLKVMPTFANAFLYLVAFVRLPKPLFEGLLRYVKPYQESAQVFGPLVIFFRALFLAKRAAYHIRRLDFSVAFGRVGYLLWRLGLVGRKRSRVSVVAQPSRPGMPLS